MNYNVELCLFSMSKGALKICIITPYDDGSFLRDLGLTWTSHEVIQTSGPRPWESSPPPHPQNKSISHD